MSSLFVILFLVSVALLVWGTVRPKSLAKFSKKPLTRKEAGAWFGAAALVFMILTGATAPPQANQNSVSTPKPAQTIQQTSDQPASKSKPKSSPKPVITTKEVTDRQPVPFTTQTQNSSALAKGTTKVIQTGVNGIETRTYKITYSNGTQTSKTLESDTVTTPPVPQITAVGTYVAPAQPSCPNGSYVNTYGNTVCRPAASSSVPAGASAKCGDGTYSYSQSRSGTCSHHGGVSEWL